MEPTSPWYNHGFSPQVKSPLALWGGIEAAKKPASPCHRHGFPPQVYSLLAVSYGLDCVRYGLDWDFGSI